MGGPHPGAPRRAACVGLEIQGAYHPVSRELSIDIASTFTERPPGGELRLNLMITEDSVIHAGFGFDQSNYYNEVEGHPLFGMGQPIYFYPHHHVVREIVDGAWGTVSVFPEQPVPGQAYTHHYDYTVPWEWRHEKVNLVLFVSLYEEEDVMQRQVLNVVELPLFDLLATAAEAPPAEAEKFSVFPNPAAGNVHFRVPPGTYRIELYTASGKLYLLARRAGGHHPGRHLRDGKWVVPGASAHPRRHIYAKNSHRATGLKAIQNNGYPSKVGQQKQKSGGRYRVE
ncbi:MAG: Omp28-related outer membrane protein [Lewinellaceae bacterium]|nr:Omp28-related outer membrane protein [Lewinellaceae bacterium]